METETIQPKRKGRPANRSYKDKQAQVIQIAKSNPELTIDKVAIQAGVCRQTASAYLAKWGINKQELDVFVENRNSIVKDKQRMILDAITVEKATKASVKDLAVCYGIMLDKDRLETGESTSNVNNWTLIVQQAHTKTVDVTP